MESALIILNQSLVMFILMMIGYFLYKKQIISSKTSAELADLVIYLAVPALIIDSFQAEIPRAMLGNSVILIVIAIITMVIALLIAKVLAPTDGQHQYAIAFGNTSFVGIPITQSLLDGEAVIYITLFISIINFLVWTYGLYLIAGENMTISLKTILLNPVNLALFVGLCLNIFGIKLPLFIKDSISLLSQLNLPLIMLVLGCYLAQGDIKKVLLDKSFYLVCFARLLLVPLVMIGLLIFLPMEWYKLKMVVLIAHATPVATLLAIFSEKYQGNFTYGATIVGASTLFSLFTLPLVIQLGEMFFL